MDKTIQVLLDILKITYFNKDIKFSVSDPKKLYLMAKENGLSGTIYQTIKDKIKNEEILAKFKKDYYFYISDDIKKTEIAKLITDSFNQLDIKHIYLKGMSIKYLYSSSYMRSKGDIDVLVKESDFDKASLALKKIGMEFKTSGPVHDTYLFGNVEIELHRRIREEDKFKKFALLDDMFSYEYMVDGNVIVVNPEIELVYLLYHIKKHFYSTGVGLRSIIDIPIYLYNLHGEIDKGKLNKLLSNTGLKAFFDNLVLICDKCFDLELCEKFNITKEFDLELYELFIAYVIESGTHGIGIDFNKFVNRFLINSPIKSKSKLSVIFPNFKMMSQMYPRMLKCKILLPIAWLRRICRLVFKDRKLTRYKVHKLKSVNENEIDRANDLFKKIGL